jgi:WD40 repeat protein
LDFAEQQKTTTPKQQSGKSDEADHAREATTLFQSVQRVGEIGGGLDVIDVRFSNDGHKSFASRNDGQSIIWDIKSDSFQIVQCGRVIGDGNLCVKSGFGSDGVKVIETSTGKELYSLSDDSNDDVVVSPSGSYIAVVTVTDGIMLFDSKNGTRIARIASAWGFDKVLFSQDESVLAANDRLHFVVYDLKRRKEITIDINDIDSFAISKKGALVWTASHFADPQVFTATGKPISRKFPNDFSLRYASSVFGGFMDADTKVVMRTILGNVGVWDWKLSKIVEIPTKAENLAVAENGVLTVTKEGVTELWDRSIKKVFTFDGSMRLGKMSADGTHVFTVTREGSLTLWDVHL